jgi:hypothetical protein
MVRLEGAARTNRNEKAKRATLKKLRVKGFLVNQNEKAKNKRLQA